jgi:hypothetical protein
MQLSAQPSNGFLVGMFADHCLYRVAGRDVEKKERDDEYAEQCRY